MNLRIVSLVAAVVAAHLLASGAPPAAAAATTRFKGFTNLQTIQIQDAVGATRGIGSPYPSAIKVSFPKGSRVADVDLYLNHLSHRFPRDLDILLVGPQGQKALVMSDVGGPPQGGAGGLTDFTLTLDDEAAKALDPFTVPSASRNRPADSDNPNPDQGDVFPNRRSDLSKGASPALSVFDGTDPNGTWRLYVVDDGAGSSGQLGEGWSLGITVKLPKRR
jgi:subtilisin-like proprotein convertase family protein